MMRAANAKVLLMAAAVAVSSFSCNSPRMNSVRAKAFSPPPAVAGKLPSRSKSLLLFAEKPRPDSLVSNSGTQFCYWIDMDRHVSHFYKFVDGAIAYSDSGKIGIGKPSTPSPANRTFYTNIVDRGPWYYDPSNTRRRSAPYAPKNPYGRVRIVLDTKNENFIIFMHGTNEPRRLGGNPSHGCLRHDNAFIERTSDTLISNFSFKKYSCWRARERHELSVNFAVRLQYQPLREVRYVVGEKCDSLSITVGNDPYFMAPRLVGKKLGEIIYGSFDKPTADFAISRAVSIVSERRSSTPYTFAISLPKK